jgi:hypothetical protein
MCPWTMPQLFNDDDDENIKNEYLKEKLKEKQN